MAFPGREISDQPLSRGHLRGVRGSVRGDVPWPYSTQALVSPSTRVRVGFFALVLYLGVRVGLELVISPGEVTALWPANPIAIALVILGPPRIRPAYFLVLFPGTLLAALPGGEFPVLMVLGPTASDAVEIFLAAWLMRRVVGTPITFTRVRDVPGPVVFGAGLGRALSGLRGARFRRRGGLGPCPGPSDMLYP